MYYEKRGSYLGKAIVLFVLYDWIPTTSTEAYLYLWSIKGPNRSGRIWIWSPTDIQPSTLSNQLARSKISTKFLTQYVNDNKALVFSWYIWYPSVRSNYSSFEFSEHFERRRTTLGCDLIQHVPQVHRIPCHILIVIITCDAYFHIICAHRNEMKSIQALFTDHFHRYLFDAVDTLGVLWSKYKSII